MWVGQGEGETPSGTSSPVIFFTRIISADPKKSWIYKEIRKKLTLML